MLGMNGRQLAILCFLAATMCLIAGVFLFVYLGSPIMRRYVSTQGADLVAGPWILVGVVIYLGLFIFWVGGGARESETPGSQVPVNEYFKASDEKRKRIGTCIVCKEKLFVGDSIASCPKCGGTAHQGDFLEWLHVKGTCPSCGEHLHDNQLRMGASSTR
jgi:predicted RNA-binding Zn-ribbon protein involved in translation (DUF1610 family)